MPTIDRATMVLRIHRHAQVERVNLTATSDTRIQMKEEDRVIYEYRAYEANPGKLADLQARFRNHTMKIFERHGMKNVAYWTVEGETDRLDYVLAFEDADQMKRAWAAFNQDPEWQRVRSESEVNGKLVGNVASTTLTPTDFSPLQ